MGILFKGWVLGGKSLAETLHELGADAGAKRAHLISRLCPTTMNLNAYEILQRTFSDVGPPTKESTARLMAAQIQWEATPGPGSFRFTLRVTDPIGIRWCHQIETLNGKQSLNYQEFTDRIHPGWMNLYLQFGVATYRVALAQAGNPVMENVAFAQKVALLQDDETYAWYEQMCYPMEVDAEGRMVSHLNVYTYLEDYRSLLPGGPRVYESFLQRTDLQNVIREQTEIVVTAAFLGKLSTTEMEVLNTFRRLSRTTQEGELTSKLVGRELGVGPHAIRKHNLAILSKVSKIFSVYGVKTVAGLAVFLKRLFVMG